MWFLLVLVCEKILQAVLLSLVRPYYIVDAQEIKHMLSAGVAITCKFGIIC